MSETVALGGVDPCSRRNPPIELPEPPRQPVLLTVRVEPGDDVGSDLSRSVSLKISWRASSWTVTSVRPASRYSGRGNRPAHFVGYHLDPNIPRTARNRS